MVLTIYILLYPMICIKRYYGSTDSTHIEMDQVEFCHKSLWPLCPGSIKGHNGVRQNSTWPICLCGDPYIYIFLIWISVRNKYVIWTPGESWLLTLRVFNYVIKYTLYPSFNDVLEYHLMIAPTASGHLEKKVCFQFPGSNKFPYPASQLFFFFFILDV